MTIAISTWIPVKMQLKLVLLVFYLTCTCNPDMSYNRCCLYALISVQASVQLNAISVITSVQLNAISVLISVQASVQLNAISVQASVQLNAISVIIQLYF